MFFLELTPVSTKIMLYYGGQSIQLAFLDVSAANDLLSPHMGHMSGTTVYGNSQLHAMFMSNHNDEY